jgi:alkyl sulfatase BDS1-like metallo-beta-lactamase superfamily hydrolase
MDIQKGPISAIAFAIAAVYALVGTYWVVELARGSQDAGSYLWTCVFVAVLCSIVFWFDQRRLKDPD